MADIQNKDRDILIFGGIALLGFGFFVMHQSIVPAKIAPINLVPAGTEAATNQNSAAVGVADANAAIAQAQIGANVAAANGQAFADAQTAQAQAQQQSALYGAAGNVVSNIIAAIGGNSNTNDYLNSDATLND